MNVTRACLPAMRKQRSGRIVSISSTAGLMGFEFCTAYSASKFGLDGWMEAHCQKVSCWYSGPVKVDHPPNDFPVPDVALQLRHMSRPPRTRTNDCDGRDRGALRDPQ